MCLPPSLVTWIRSQGTMWQEEKTIYYKLSSDLHIHECAHMWSHTYAHAHACMHTHIHVIFKRQTANIMHSASSQEVINAKMPRTNPGKGKARSHWVCSLCLDSLVRSDKDTGQWIPHLATTSAAGPGTQLQLACRPPSSRPVQKDSREEGQAVPRLPWLPADISWPLPKSHFPCLPEPRDRVQPSKVAKAAFLWTTQEMYVRRLSLSCSEEGLNG